MGQFRNLLIKFDKTFLTEADLINDIRDILNTMSEDEIDELGYYLILEFYDLTEEEMDELDDTYFDIDNVMEMIEDLGEDFYEYIMEMILPDDSEIDDDNEHYEDEEIEEGVSKVMKVKNINRKKRKFFKKSLATLRQTKAERKRMARKNRASRRNYQRVNKVKIKNYQKSRSNFIKKGAHNVKIRRKGG